jgi:prepilin-type processing-associated H-X9-DG protein
MKPHISNQKTAALTLIEVVVVVVMIAVLALIILPTFSGGPHHAPRINCVNNLKQIGLGYRIWIGDQGRDYQTQISVTNGGVRELVQSGIAYVSYQVMSNELYTPKILICPSDADRFAATNFSTGFGNKNVSYFVGVDASEMLPLTLLSGDDNFEIGGVPVKSGLLQFSTNTPIAWTTARHNRAGNIGFADGSVESFSNTSLTNWLQSPTNWLQKIGLTTNRLAIP